MILFTVTHNRMHLHILLQSQISSKKGVDTDPTMQLYITYNNFILQLHPHRRVVITAVFYNIITVTVTQPQSHRHVVSMVVTYDIIIITTEHPQAGLHPSHYKLSYYKQYLFFTKLLFTKLMIMAM